MKRIFLTTLTSLIALTSASAQSLTASYDFTGQPGNQLSTPLAINSLPSALSLSAITRGSGLSPNAVANSMSSTSWNSPSFDSNDYYGFTIMPGSGSVLSLTNLNFTLRRSASGPVSFQVRTSLDGFSAALTSFSLAPSLVTDVNQSIDLSSLTNLSAPLTLRLYGFGASSAAGALRLNNTLTLTGTATAASASSAAPEPSVIILLLLGLGVLVRSRSRF
jgi:hypothetical protein